MKRRDPHQYLKSRESDCYFIKAKKEGYKARSAYKLIEMQEKFKLFKNNDYCLDIGCAPGAWIQVIHKLFNNITIYGIDLLEINNLPYVNFIKNNIYNLEILKQFENIKFNCILCDIAPNCSGNRRQDSINSYNLIEFIINNYLLFLEKNGNFCTKIFENGELNILINQLKQKFKTVKIFKPKASNNDSCEIYIIANGYLII